MKKTDELQLVRIAKVKDSWQANRLRAELEAKGIQAETSGEPLSHWQIGIPSEVSVLVSEHDRVRASAIADQILAAMQRGQLKSSDDVRASSISPLSTRRRKGLGGYLAMELAGLVVVVMAAQGDQWVLATTLLLGLLVVTFAVLFRRHAPQR